MTTKEQQNYLDEAYDRKKDDEAEEEYCQSCFRELRNCVCIEEVNNEN